MKTPFLKGLGGALLGTAIALAAWHLYEDHQFVDYWRAQAIRQQQQAKETKP